MSAKMMGRVWDLVLTPPKQIVLLALADHASHDGADVKPGVPLIAWKTGYSERQVQRIMKELEADGLLVPVRHRAGKPTIYRLDLDKGVQKATYVPREARATHDKTSQVKPKTTHDILSPRQDDGVTSDGEDGGAGGDMPSAEMTRIRQKDQPSVEQEQKETTTTTPVPEPMPLTLAVAAVVVVDAADQVHWETCLSQLEMQLDTASFETSLRGAVLLSVERAPHPAPLPPSPPVFVVGVRSDYARTLLAGRLARSVRRVLGDVVGGAADLRFEVREALPDFDAGEEPLYRRLAAEQPVVGQPGAPDVRGLFERFIGAITPEREASVAHLEAHYSAEEVGHALTVLAAKQARGGVFDPLAFVMGVLRKQAMTG